MIYGKTKSVCGVSSHIGRIEHVPNLMAFRTWHSTVVEHGRFASEVVIISRPKVQLEWGYRLPLIFDKSLEEAWVVRRVSMLTHLPVCIYRPLKIYD